MFDRQVDLKIKFLKQGIKLDDFFFTHIKITGVSYSSFRSMFYGNQKMKDEVLTIIEKYLGEPDETAID